MTVKTEKNPRIIEQFKVAGRWVNEWRDTLFYGALVTAAAANNFLGVPEFLPLFVYGGVVREMARGCSWYCENQKEELSHNDSSEQPTAMQCMNATAPMFGYSIAYNLANDMLLSGSMVQTGVIGLFVGLNIVYGSICASEAGGVKGVVQAYKKMWNWPRTKKNTIMKAALQ